MSVPFYRAVPILSSHELNVENHRAPTSRLPSNVPYIVDNLWEFIRPDDRPSRRHAVYASPIPQSALYSASNSTTRNEYEIYVVSIKGDHKIAQLDVQDARDHPDVRNIQALVKRKYESWNNLSWDARCNLAMLFAPGCKKSDWEYAIKKDDITKNFVDEMIGESRFWESIHEPKSGCDGEIFFELIDDASYRLQNLTGPK